ncbi:ABC transporter ATP-binding protein [Schumannella luteola]|uniref:Putative ABC transport system ATP-binding protein n=1 Tax=Schumannella luteola TaxID=472059 RepID=A0A852YKH6_9MICO|nr:ABC transporter ATP-binding protein [Schumannella luteola]NYG97705.1 putative ABC transport system ATP-binding protein [Schumannella luteola]TPX01427.1 ABC transporter ATP-binding protein [Schumannella luteola]
MTVIEASALTKNFPRPGGGISTVLSGIDLAIAESERVAIVGASGSGKSTLLNCLSGLEPVTSGVVRLLGNDLTSIRSSAMARLYREQVGFVFQQYNLVAALSAFENVALPLRLGRKKVDSAFVQESLRRLGLADRIRSRPAQLSGGEQQRVAIARAMVTDPRIIFADEPTGALDTQNGELVMSALEAVKQRGTALVYVTHDPVLAARADRVVLVRDGRVVSETTGTTAEQIVESLRNAETRS